MQYRLDQSDSKVVDASGDATLTFINKNRAPTFLVSVDINLVTTALANSSGKALVVVYNKDDTAVLSLIQSSLAEYGGVSWVGRILLNQNDYVQFQIQKAANASTDTLLAKCALESES